MTREEMICRRALAAALNATPDQLGTGEAWEIVGEVQEIICKAFRELDGARTRRTEGELRLKITETDAYDPNCPKCDEGWVCENHRDKGWPSVCDCGAGAPCSCNPLSRAASPQMQGRAGT